jgi:hypothetical protein
MLPESAGAFEVLDRALVFLCGFTAIKRAKVLALLRFRIDFARVESILS